MLIRISERHTWILGVLIAAGTCMGLNSGCQQEFDNISESREASAIVGREFVSSQPLVAMGVTTDPDYREGVTYYSIKKPPGTSGPEILERFVLPSGTRINIKRVLRCDNCWFMNGLVADIEVEWEALAGKQVRLVDLLQLDKSQRKIMLDARYFVKSDNQ